MTTDMEDGKRWTIKAFDTSKANRKETPSMNEDVGGYENHAYSQWEQEELKARGFHWVPKDKNWFNDNYRGNQTVSIYRDGYDNHLVMLHTYYDHDGQYQEEFDHYKHLNDLIEELP
jgi:hypothetical protein